MHTVSTRQHTHFSEGPVDNIEADIHMAPCNSVGHECSAAHHGLQPHCLGFYLFMYVGRGFIGVEVGACVSACVSACVCVPVCVVKRVALNSWQSDPQLSCSIRHNRREMSAAHTRTDKRAHKCRLFKPQAQVHT